MGFSSLTFGDKHHLWTLNDPGVNSLSHQGQAEFFEGTDKIKDLSFSEIMNDKKNMEGLWLFDVFLDTM